MNRDRLPLRLAPLFLLAGIVLVPWSVYLERALPAQHQAQHWDVAWIGFDAALALVLAAVGISAARRSPWLEGMATAAAALLFVDAWFDVLTAKTMSEVTSAVVEAAVLEVPLGLVCVWIARAAKRHLASPVALNPPETIRA